MKQSSITIKGSVVGRTKEWKRARRQVRVEDNFLAVRDDGNNNNITCFARTQRIHITPWNKTQAVTARYIKETNHEASSHHRSAGATLSL